MLDSQAAPIEWLASKAAFALMLALKGAYVPMLAYEAAPATLLTLLLTFFIHIYHNNGPSGRI